MSKNEIGASSPRGRPEIPKQDMEHQLSEMLGEPVELGENVVAHSGPTTCPACGSSEIEWGCSEYQQREKDEIHPLVWHETESMADSFLCRACHAGWIEPDDPEPITWVRPYWVVK